MKKNNKHAIKIFQKSKGILSMSEAISLGIHRRELYELRDSGQLEVIQRGLYKLITTPDLTFPDFIPVAKKIPNGVICLISALSFHQLTTQIPHFVYIAIPQNANKSAITYPPMRYFWYSKELINTGVIHHKIDGCLVKIFDIEKTLVDCIKFRNKIGMDITIEALKIYWASNKKNLDKLFEYSKQFRVYKTLKPIMEIITSG